MSGLTTLDEIVERQARSHLTCFSGHASVNESGVCLTCHRLANCQSCGTPLRVTAPLGDERGHHPQTCPKCQRYN